MSDSNSTIENPTQRALRIIARGKVTLPVEFRERSLEEKRRRNRWVGLAMVVIPPVAFVVYLSVKGILPFFNAGDAALPLTDPLMLGVLVAGILAPAAIGAYTYFRIMVVRPRPDEADHPWRFRADDNGLTVTRIGGVLQGEWSRWRYVGCDVVFSQVPSVTALSLSLDGQQIKIPVGDLPEGWSLGRAILQHLGDWQSDMGPADGLR